MYHRINIVVQSSESKILLVEIIPNNRRYKIMPLCSSPHRSRRLFIDCVDVIEAVIFRAALAKKDHLSARTSVL